MTALWEEEKNEIQVVEDQLVLANSMKEKLIESGLFDYIYASPLRTARGISKEGLERLFANNKTIFAVGKELEEKTAKRKEILADDKVIQEKIESENTMADLQVRISDSAYEGLQEILLSKQEKDLVYVTGSLYLVGEMKEQNFG